MAGRLKRHKATSFGQLSESSEDFTDVSCATHQKDCAGLPGRPTNIRTKQSCRKGWRHIDESVGAGVYGKVTKLTCGDTLYVVKSLSSETPENELRNEVLLQNILSKAEIAPEVITYYKDRDGAYRIVMRALTGTLLQRIQDLRHQALGVQKHQLHKTVGSKRSKTGEILVIKSPKKVLWSYINECFSLISMLHELNITHGDTHTENFMFDAEGRLRLIDFGLTTIYDEGYIEPDAMIADYMKLLTDITVRLGGPDANPELIEVIKTFEKYVRRLPMPRINMSNRSKCKSIMRSVKNKLLNIVYSKLNSKKKDAFLEKFADDLYNVFVYIDKFLPADERTVPIKQDDDDGDDAYGTKAIEDISFPEDVVEVEGTVKAEVNRIIDILRSDEGDETKCGSYNKQNVILSLIRLLERLT